MLSVTKVKTRIEQLRGWIIYTRGAAILLYLLNIANPSSYCCSKAAL